MDMNQQLQNCYSAYQRGDFASAEQQYTQIVQAYLNLGDAHHLGALIASRSRRNPVALTRIEMALNANPDHFEYLNTKGNICSALQDFPAAIKAYKDSLAAKPEYFSAAQNLGKCLIDYDDPVRAFDVYSAALKHHPENELLQIGRVIARKEMMQSEQALALLDAMPSVQKNVQNHAYVRGQLLMQSEDYAASIKANDQALTDPATAVPALQNILQVLWMQNRWGEALEKMDTYLEKAGHSVSIYVAVARLLAKSDDRPAALAMLKQAEEHHGPQPDILAARARFRLEDGQMSAAYDDALAALTARPGDIDLMVDFADSALAAGRPADALTAATEALKAVPNNQFWIAVKYTAMRALGQDYQYYTNIDEFVQAYEIEPPEGFTGLKDYNLALKQALDDMHSLSEHPLDQSLRNGTQTIPDLRFVDHPVLKAHFKALDKPIRAYMKHLGYDTTHPLLKRNTGEYHIAGSWSVKLRTKGFHVSHVHPKGWISSAYYVDVPDEVADKDKKAGWIHFGKPPFSIRDVNGRMLGYEKIVQPKVGTLVLFPSYLWHGTNPLAGDATRMTLPIDVVPN